MADNTCVCCGKIIPEGRHVCVHCGSYDDMQTFKLDTLPVVRTNGDRIRQMTDEELAKWVHMMERRALFTDGVTPVSEWLKWLRSEVQNCDDSG